MRTAHCIALAFVCVCGCSAQDSPQAPAIDAPDLWLENVELVAARQIGRETVNYVRNIFTYYIAYRMAWEEARLPLANDELQTQDPAQNPTPD